MQPSPQSLLLWFIGLLLVFRLIEFTRPREQRRPILRRGFVTDVCYWVFTPLATHFVTLVSVVIAIIPFALIVHGRLDKALVEGGFGPASRLPLWQQAVLILLITDFIGYWSHRWFHGRRLWRIHAIHHSSTDLDWLSSVRVHPLNEALTRVVTTLPVLMLGFAPIAVAGVVPWLTLMAIVIHANVDWDWGPFRVVLASPRFHRWHHTDEAHARDKNFAGMLPLWDILFGTYYMPRDRRPASFGTDTPVPGGLIGQLMFPFRKQKPV